VLPNVCNCNAKRDTTEPQTAFDGIVNRDLNAIPWRMIINADNDLTMSHDKPEPTKPIHDALSLDGDPGTVKAFYANWAVSYDTDVAANYRGTQEIVDVLDGYLNDNPSDAFEDRAQLKVADMGCGTGLVAEVLRKVGFRTIDGMDLSPEMVAEAKKLDIYRSLFADVDINKTPPVQWKQAYDITVSCGVFTLGHVAPTALYSMIALTRPGGLVVTSTRLKYYKATDYQQVSDQIQTQGLAELVHSARNRPYTDDDDAHYWVYRIH